MRRSAALAAIPAALVIACSGPDHDRCRNPGLLRQNLASQPGEGILTETFTCRKSVIIGDADTIRCDVPLQGRGFVAFEIYGLEEDGILQLNMGVR